MNSKINYSIPMVLKSLDKINEHLTNLNKIKYIVVNKFNNFDLEEFKRENGFNFSFKFEDVNNQIEYLSNELDNLQIDVHLFNLKSKIKNNLNEESIQNLNNYYNSTLKLLNQLKADFLTIKFGIIKIGYLINSANKNSDDSAKSPELDNLIKFLNDELIQNNQIKIGLNENEIKKLNKKSNQIKKNENDFCIQIDENNNLKDNNQLFESRFSEMQIKIELLIDLYSIQIKSILKEQINETNFYVRLFLAFIIFFIFFSTIVFSLFVYVI